MTNMSGADSDALDRVGAQLERSGVDLRTRGQRLQRSINASPWHGPSAERFRHDFATVHMRSITEAARFLDDAKEALRSNAQQQRDASGVTGGGSRGIPWLGPFPTLRVPGWRMLPFQPFRHLDNVMRLPALIGPNLGQYLRDHDGLIDVGDPDWSKKFFFGDKIAKHFGAVDAPDHRTDWNVNLLSGGVERHGAVREGELSGSSALGYGIVASGVVGGSVLSAGAGASGGIGLGPNGLTANARAHAEANLIEGRAGGSIGNGVIGASGSVEGRVGANASADGSLTVGPNGVGAHAGAGAFAGGELSGQVGVDLGGVKPSVKGSVSYGIGAHANVDGHIGFDKVKVSADLGATLGIGGGVKVDVEVDPGKVVHNVSKAWHSVNPFD